MKTVLRVRGVVAALAAAVGLTAFTAFAQTAPQITSGPSVGEAEITDSTAVVRWMTNVESTSVVNFGKTSSLGQEFKKIIPIEETEITEISHSMTLWGLDADTTYFYQVRSQANGLTAQSAVFQFTTKAAACTADAWDCGAWGACAKGTDGKYAQSRSCALKTDCPTVETPKPVESQTCVPACVADVWDCGGWGDCVKGADGASSQSRSCTLTNDCAGVSTPKPAESQACTVACAADLWTCGAWGSCSADGEQTRSCALTTDCATATTPKPAESRSCTAAPAEPAPAPAPPAPPNAGVDLSAVFALRLDATKSLDDECVTGGILPDRCAAWLEAKYTDTSCAEAGLFTRESCEKYLSDKAGGTFPGCEGKTDEECGAIRTRATLGYLPAEEKKRVDEIITTKKVAEAFAELGDAAPLLVAVREEKKDEVRWWPSAKKEGGETSPGFIVFDADKDGLPDDMERRLGTDPRKADLAAADGLPGANVSRDILKKFFEKGDTPTEFVLIDTNGDGVADLVDDRKLLGLRKYDPSQIYLIGDTARVGDDVGVDTDGDGEPNGKLSKTVLKSFFEKGDTPTEARRGDKPASGQFSDVIDSVDLAFLRGNAIEQPVAAGETDSAFRIGLAPLAAYDDFGNEGDYAGGRVAAPPLQTDREIIRCKVDDNCPPEYPFCRDGYCYGDGVDANSPAPPGYRTVSDGNKDVAGKSNVLKGKAVPNTTVLLYVYSYVPMVLTTTTDENGDFSYDLSDNVVDGQHEVYVAVTDDTGKITKKSEPLAFFVKGAVAATSEEDFLKPDVNVRPDEAIANYSRYYLYGTIALVLVALGFGWMFVSRMKGEVKA